VQPAELAEKEVRVQKHIEYHRSDGTGKGVAHRWLAVTLAEGLDFLVSLSFGFGVRDFFRLEETSWDLQANNLLKAGSTLNSDQVAQHHVQLGPENI